MPIRSFWFQSTLPVGGGTYYGMDASTAYAVSIHPPRGGRDIGEVIFSYDGAVSIHPPRGGRDVLGRDRVFHPGGFNPPSPWGEGLCHASHARKTMAVSIHPPRGGRDWGTSASGASPQRVSIHPPRGGRDRQRRWGSPGRRSFNPPSPWGEGRTESASRKNNRGFNPPSPWGEGQQKYTKILFYFMHF